MIAVNDAFLEPTIEAITTGGRTGPGGQIGDGKILVLPLKTVSASEPANAAARRFKQWIIPRQTGSRSAA